MASNKITYNRGTTKNMTVNYNPSGGANGSTILFTVKSDVDSSTADTTALVTKSPSMTANSGVITISPGDIAATWDEGDYVYDIKVKDTNGDITLLFEGVFTLNASATNRTS